MMMEEEKGRPKIKTFKQSSSDVDICLFRQPAVPFVRIVKENMANLD